MIRKKLIQLLTDLPEYELRKADEMFKLGQLVRTLGGGWLFYRDPRWMVQVNDFLILWNGNDSGYEVRLLGNVIPPEESKYYTDLKLLKQAVCPEQL